MDLPVKKNCCHNTFIHIDEVLKKFNSDIKLFSLWFDPSVCLLPSLPAAAAQEAADAPPAEGDGGRDGNQYGDDDIQTVILEPVQVM